MNARKISSATLGLVLIAGAATLAAPHSLNSLENQLGNREKNFLAINLDAPGFESEDADRRRVRLTDFPGKIVVLHFIYFAPEVNYGNAYLPHVRLFPGQARNQQGKSDQA